MDMAIAEGTPFLEVDASDEAEFQAIALERRWSDGLPVVAPTPERVDAMLASVDADPTFSLGRVPPMGRVATLDALATNAVMAGCDPKWFPVVVAATAAALDPLFNLESMIPTTHPVSTFVCVGGPAAQDLGYNGGPNALGPGNAANATTGRALRLILQNIGGGRSPEVDQSTQGGPGKYTYCAAENEEANPWASLHVDRGFAPDESAVTVFGGANPTNIVDYVSTTPEGILYTAASTIAGTGSNNAYYMGQIVLFLAPEHARVIAGGGWKKTDIQRFLYDMARNTMRDLKRGGMWGMEYWPAWFRTVDDDHRLPLVEHPDDIVVIVLGGAGRQSSCMHAWTGTTEGVSRPVLTEGLDALI
ncbi:MAG: hypothetical protein AB7T48_04455 [Solirubrobacterales bacterium]